MKVHLALFSIVSLTRAASGAPLTGEEICQRLVVQEEIYILNSSGDRLQDALDVHKHYRHGKTMPNKDAAKGIACVLNGGSHSSSTILAEPMIFSHQWTIGDDGQIRVSVSQYDEAGQGEKRDSRGPLLKKEDFVIKDMNPIIWVSPLHKTQRVVVRLLPTLKSNDKSQDLVKMPLSGEDVIITDSKGNVWAKNVTMAAPYIGLVTARGALMLSYYPFKGAKKLGEAQQNEIELALDDKTYVVLSSKLQFLPAGVTANVYGYFDPTQKSEGFTSLRLITDGKEESFLERLDQKK